MNWEGYIKYARKFLSRETLKMLYLGLVEPVIPYGVLAVQFYDKKVKRMQHRAVRTITVSRCNAQTSPLLKLLKLSSIQDIIQQETVGMVYRATNNQAPEYLSVLFNRVSAMTGRTIPNANINLRPPRLKATFAQNCFAHRGPLVWDNLSTEINSAIFYDSFKNN